MRSLEVEQRPLNRDEWAPKHGGLPQTDTEGNRLHPKQRTASNPTMGKKAAEKMRAASDEDIQLMISEDTIVTVNGKPVVVYLRMSEDLEGVRAAFQRIRYVEDYRTAGLKTNSRTIGFLPRNTLRRDFCTTSSSAGEHPVEHATAIEAARIAAAYYQRWNPEQYAWHMEQARKIRPEWHLLETPFTSGIINDNNPLKYHFDSGNIKRAWSAMMGFKRSTEGGHLSTPELVTPDGKAIGFEICDKSLLLFDGQGTLHGVTPIRKTRTDAHRFTVVFYSLQQMWNCVSPADELARIRRLRTEREQKRAKGGHNPKAPTGRAP